MKLNQESLVHYFQQGIRPQQGLLVGTEYEKFLVSEAFWITADL